MNPRFLPKRIYMEELISVLSLDQMPVIRALKTIFLYAKHDGLPICFDDTVTGIDASVPIGPQYDQFGDSIELEIADPDQMRELNGPKAVHHAFAYQPESKNDYRISVSSFYLDGVLYFIPHESGAALADLDLGMDSLYCDRDAFEVFTRTMENRGKPNTQSTGSQQRDPVNTPELKALALLAREAADGAAHYRVGNKVNAAKFKDHILQLAKKYTQSEHGLRSLDDKINKTLNELDLKEIPDQNNS